MLIFDFRENDRGIGVLFELVKVVERVSHIETVFGSSCGETVEDSIFILGGCIPAPEEVVGGINEVAGAVGE